MSEIVVRKLHADYPLFLVRGPTQSVLYFPGRLSPLPEGCDEKTALAAATPAIWSELRELEERAREWRDAPFRPKALLIYLTDECEGGCKYCFSRPKPPGRGQRVSLSSVRTAAERVARNCSKEGLVLRAAIHGGGEPTLYPEWIVDVLDTVEDAANREGIGVQFHLSTNGQIPLRVAESLGKRFHSIGLSCDGPADIELSHGRPGNADRLIACSAVWRDMGVEVSVRSTVTPASVARQSEMVRSHRELLGVTQMRFEPVYGASRGPGQGLFESNDADLFVSSFMEAARTAEELDCELSLSGVRLDEIHGPYCTALSQVLLVTPNGGVAGCFFDVEGRWDPGEEDALSDWRRETGRIPERCGNCLNAYHCARGCPDWCLGEATPRHRESAEFRCRVYRELSPRWILQAAGETFAAGRSLPSPSWATRGLEDRGGEAWNKLKERALRDRASAQEERGPLSVYVHAPFCAKRCPFCDCRAVELGKYGRNALDRLLDRLLFEVSSWKELPGVSERPVTTVHFGGGTPGLLGHRRMREVVSALKGSLGTDEDTEWALESTCSLLSQTHLAPWREMGFRRLHAGVQSLDPREREMLGRRGSTARAVEGLRAALLEGMVVSVDLLYGLPGQRIGDWLEGLRALRDLGIHGFSLYQLQVPPRAQRHWSRWGGVPREKEEVFPFLREAEAFLLDSGFQKLHFAHYAAPEDRYLYYLHWKRGEDLLALGPTSDGTWGRYRYRHVEIQPYLKGPPKMASLLQGGLSEEDDFSALQASLMAGGLNRDQLCLYGLERLAEKWIGEGLLRECEGQRADYALTALGSWEISRMLERIEDRGRSLHPV